MRMKPVIVSLLLTCIASTASADLVDGFENYSQGSKANGTTVGPWYSVVMSPGSCEIVTSPFADGGNNAFRVNGASDKYVRIQAVDSFTAVTNGFKYTMDFNLKSVLGANGRFLDIYGDAGYIVRIGSQAVSTSNFYLTVSGVGGAMSTVDQVYLSALDYYTLEITSAKMSDGKYDLLLKNKVNGNTIISLTDQALMTNLATQVNRVYLGNLQRTAGTSAILTMDNVSLTSVPEPATMTLLSAGTLLFAKKRR